VLFATLHASLTLILIYCRYRCDAAKLIALQVFKCPNRDIFVMISFNILSAYRKCVHIEIVGRDEVCILWRIDVLYDESLSEV